jgi:hypothetical protein
MGGMAWLEFRPGSTVEIEVMIRELKERRKDSIVPSPLFSS